MTTTTEVTPVSLHPPAPTCDPRTLLERVWVRPPYLALRDLAAWEPGACSAWLSPEQALDGEAGPITASECVRHLELLGTLAAASLAYDLEPRLYPVRAARLERASEPAPGRAQSLQAVARAHLTRPGDAVANGVLRTPGGGVVYRLSSEHAVLDHRAFERAFQDEQRATPHPGRNPHVEAPRLDVDVLDARRATARVRFDVGHCAGHFDRFPAIPLSRLLQTATALGGHVLRLRRARPRASYLVRQADIRVQQLAFAGETLWLAADALRDEGEEVAFRCTARSHRGVVGEVHLWLVSPDEA